MDHTETAEQVGEQLGVSPKTIKSWAREGCPHRKDSGQYLFDVSAAFAWAKKNDKRFSPGRPRRPLSAALEAARVKKEEALAATYEHRLERERGRFVEVTEARDELRKILLAIKSEMMEIPRQLGLKGKTCSEAEAIVRDILRTTANKLKEVVMEDRGAGTK